MAKGTTGTALHLAQAKVDASVPSSTGYGFSAILKNGTGDFTCTLNDAIAAGEFVALGSLDGVQGDIEVNATAGIVTVLTFDNANAAADIDFSLVVLAHSPDVLPTS